MAFWGNSFIFNGIPCEDFDLMIYDIGGNSQGQGKFASTVSIVEDTLVRKWKPYFYATNYEKKLEFSMVFGVNQRRIDAERFLDRYEMEAIASWLTGQSEYMWLEIEQPDLEYIRYRCIVTELNTIAYGNIPWAMEATIICDSPYAYLYPQMFEYTITGAYNLSFYNESSHNGYFCPKIEIEPKKGGDFSVINKSDGDREFKFSGLPTTIKKICIDNDNCIITNDQDLNIYPNFNFKFMRFVKGENNLEITGNGLLRFICEFPVNVGG